MPAPWNEIYRLHFQDFFGKPFEIQSFHGPDGADLSLATYDAARQGFQVYASLGLAEQLAKTGDDAFGEAILYSDVRDPQIPKMFVQTLFFILQQKISIGSRFAIGFGGPDHAFAERYDKTALYFTRPAIRDEKDRFNVLRRGEEFGRVYQAYFISTEEDEFVDKHGADEFEFELHKQFADIDRPKNPGPPPQDQSKMKEHLAKVDRYVLLVREHEQRLMNKALSVRRPSCV